MTAVAANHVVRDAGRRVSSVGKSPQEKEQARDKTVILLANQLTNVLGGMKGAAMKVGQMLSVLDMPYLPDEVAPQFQERLAVLRDQAPEVDAATMSAAVAHELGRPLDQVFSRFGTGAVASASIGQVYRATLHDGREVAVKIKYPGIDDAVRADIKNLVAFLKFWRRKLPALGSKQLIAELRSTLASELDYVAEARNQASLASAYEGHPFIVVPRVVEGLSTDQMLVTEWFDGEPLASATTHAAHQRDRIGEIVYRFYIGSIYRLGEFSGDPHPGNVLLGSDGRLGFVDFGSYKQIDADAREFELAVWRAGAAQSYNRLCLPFLAPLMLRDGHIDPRIAESVPGLAERVSVTPDGNPDGNALSPQRLVLRRHDGSQIERAIPANPGSPQAPLAPREAEAKFALCRALACPADPRLFSDPLSYATVPA